jgi:hypothetical protein
VTELVRVRGYDSRNHTFHIEHLYGPQEPAHA